MRYPTLGLLPMFAVALIAWGCAGPTANAPTAPDSGRPKVDRVVLAFEPPAAFASHPRKICCNDHHQLRPMYENLIGIQAETGKMTPQLATEWGLEPDGQSVRFKLRKGVKFNGGEWGEFSARDVVHSWEALVGNADSHNRSVYWKATVKQIDVVNDAEVLMRIVPEAQFFNGISELYGQVLMHSKAYFDAKGDNKDDVTPPPGTGAYQYQARDLTSYVRFERASFDHWRAKPDFRELEIKWIREPSTRLAALLAGELHITKLPTDLMPQAVKSGMKVVASRVPGTRVFGQFSCCYFNADGSWPMFPNSPLLNIKVRQALNKAIDRDELKKVFAPAGEPMYNNHFHPSRLAWDPTWQARFKDAYGYDPERAKALLAEAGYTAANPLTVGVLMNDILQISGARDLAEAIAGYWRQIGVSPQLVQLDAATQAAQARAFKFDVHFSITGTAGDQIQGIFVYGTNLNTPSAQAYYTPDFINLYRQKISSYMEPERWLPGLKEFGELQYTQQQNVPLWYLPVEAVVNPSVVKDYVFPGAVHSTWTHMENISAAK